MSLFSLFRSLPLTTLLCFTLSVYVSLTLSLATLSRAIALSSFCFAFFYFCAAVYWVHRVKTNTYSSCKETFYCLALCFLVVPLHRLLLLFLSSSSSLFHTAETMRFKCPDATSCKLSETLWRTLPLLNTALKAIWLELLR